MSNTFSQGEKYMDRKEWLSWRHQGIGASDAACLYDASPYKTRYELWQEKCLSEPKEEKSSFITEKGNRLEPEARKLFCAEYNMMNGTDEEFAPKLVQRADYPFIRASLDGCSAGGQIIIEIKFQGKAAHDAVKNGEVPKNYWIQIQHQLLVTDALMAYLVSYNEGTVNHCVVKPDAEFMLSHLKACQDFWDLVQAKKAPPISLKDFKPLRAKGAAAKVLRWKKLKAKAEVFGAEAETLKEEILKMVDHPRMVCNGVSIVQSEGRAGGIDYSALIGALKIDAATVEKYRKPQGKPYYVMKAEC
jgi:putative phage-type endonuclease